MAKSRYRIVLEQLRVTCSDYTVQAVLLSDTPVMLVRRQSSSSSKPGSLPSVEPVAVTSSSPCGSLGQT